MSADGQPRREVAHRVFAAEFDDATLSHAESDEERAPNYVVTPTGARINRLFVVGVLTEIEAVSSEQLRARIVDPTGAFVVYAGQYQPDALAALDELSAPAFVAVTGKARTFQPEDSERVYTSIRPESIGTVDATVRDRWTVGTAERTLERVRTAIDAHERAERGEDLRATLHDEGVSEALAAGVSLAFEHYDTTPTYLGAVGDLALDAARVVAGEREEVTPLDVAPDEGGASERSSAEFDATTDTETVAAGAATGEPADDGATTDATDSTAASADSAAASTDNTDTIGESDPESDAETGIEANTGSPASAESATETVATESGSDGASDHTSSDETSDGTSSTGTSETAEDAGAPEGANAPGESETSASPESHTDAGDANTETDSTEVSDAPDEIEEFDLDPEERDRLETEYGTEFERGSEVDDPGEADIETPEPSQSDAEGGPEPGDADATTEPATPAEPAMSETDADDESEVETIDPGDTDESDTEAEEDTADESETTIDLEDAAMDAMREHADGDGAEGAAVIDAVVEEHDVERGAVDDAIEAALMEGRCYEPEDGVFKPI